MIVDSMTHSEVYKEIDKDMEELVMWWSGKRKMLKNIAKWTIKLPRTAWYEYTSTRKNRYLVMSIIMGRDYNNEGLTCLMALRKMDRGYAIYTSRFPWQRIANPHAILPHVFDQYHNPERGNVPKTGIELIKHFMEHNNHGQITTDDRFSGRSVRYKGRDNLCKCVTDGVLLGEVVDNIFVVHTFITYEMASGLQREEFDSKKEKILSQEEFVRQYKEAKKEEYQQLREEVIAQVMREKNNKLINV